MYLEAQDLTIVRFPDREHRFTDFVMGPTIVTAREVALAHPFAPVAAVRTRASSVDVVGRGRGSTRPIGSTSSRCGIPRRRTPGRSSSAELLASARVVGYGLLTTPRRSI